MSKSGTNISYTYNSDGLRTSKTVNELVTTKYLYNGSTLIGMDTELGTVYFHYDATGVMAMEVQGTMLYYAKNAQGDVMALVDTNGYPVVEYSYDAWGNITDTTGIYATTYGLYNPFRYRGYFYDDETGLYYLQSRYYNPEMGRFICADSHESTGQGLFGTNMFAYCQNNPVMNVDPSGKLDIPFFARLVINDLLPMRLFLLLVRADAQNHKGNKELANRESFSEKDGNCYGNAIQKYCFDNPSFYSYGDSVFSLLAEVTYDVGWDSIRVLNSIDAPIGEDEYMVAMKTSATDYHFIRFDAYGWYNKPGIQSGEYVDNDYVESKIWKNGESSYDSITIYVAVKKDWWCYL